MRIDPIPPLNSLVAFEAAARHLGFTLAAQELNVTSTSGSQYYGQVVTKMGVVEQS